MGRRNEGGMERRRGIEGVERGGGKIVKGERREGGKKKEK